MPAGVKASKLAEARAIARRVRDARRRGGVPRESDVVVLARAATDLHVFERALEREGFATLAGGGRGYWLRQPVQDLTQLPRRAGQPARRARAATARSPARCAASPPTGWRTSRPSPGSRATPWRAVRSVALARRLGGGGRAPRLEAFLVRFAVERDRRRPLRPRRADRARGRSSPATTCTCSACPAGAAGSPTSTSCSGWPPRTRPTHGRDVRGFIDHATAEAEADVREADAPGRAGGRARRSG